jgi:hypothetical protein
MKYLLYPCFICFLLTATACKKELTFEKIEHETIYRKRQPAHTSKYLSESWIVHNYRDNENSEAKIDAFVCAYIDTISRPYGSLSLTFYRYSKRYTNMKVLTRRYDNISESMSHDYLWHYTFDKEGFSGKTKVKNFEKQRFFFPEPSCIIEKKQVKKG